jgi:hypothetical protein
VTQQGPVIVRLIEPPHDPTGLADVLVGVLGLSGVLGVAGILIGIAVGGVMYWLRSRPSA